MPISIAPSAVGRWVLVAVTKADLFLPHIEKIRALYSPAGDGPFVSALRQLQAQVGLDHFAWTALPVCGWPEDFHWHNEVVPSQVNVRQRAFYAGQLAEQIKALCLAK